MDLETLEILDRLGAGLRGEIRTSAAGHLHRICEQMRETESGTRRQFDVVAESLRGDIRGLAEGMALSDERSQRRDDEQAARTDRLEGGVLKLEVRISGLEAGRNPLRPSRRR